MPAFARKGEKKYKLPSMGNIFDVEARDGRNGPWCGDCICEHIEWDDATGHVKRTLIDNPPANMPFFTQMQRDTLLSPPAPAVAGSAPEPSAWTYGLRVDIGNHARLYLDDETDDVYLWRHPSRDVLIPRVIHPDLVRFAKALLGRGNECGICRLRRGSLVRLTDCGHREMCTACLLELIEDALSHDSDHIICPVCRQPNKLRSLVPVKSLRDGCDGNAELTDTERRVMGIALRVPADVAAAARKLLKRAAKLDGDAALFPYVPNRRGDSPMHGMVTTVDQTLSELIALRIHLSDLGLSTDDPLIKHVHDAGTRIEAHQRRIRDSPALATPPSERKYLQEVLHNAYTFIDEYARLTQRERNRNYAVDTRRHFMETLSVAEADLEDPWGRGWIGAIDRVRRVVDDIERNGHGIPR